MKFFVLVLKKKKYCDFSLLFIMHVHSLPQYFSLASDILNMMWIYLEFLKLLASKAAMRTILISNNVQGKRPALCGHC